MAAWVTHTTVLLVGLSVGIMWSPLHRPERARNRALSKQTKEDRELVAQMIKAGGEATAAFAEQFVHMKCLTNEYPLQVCASPDGRFVIRLLNRDGTIAGEIASDLEYPDDAGAVNELDRRYSFVSEGRTYSLDVGRRVEGSTPTSVLFTFTDGNGRELVYFDRNADGQWDSLKDRHGDSEQLFERDGLCWKVRGD